MPSMAETVIKRLEKLKHAFSNPCVPTPFRPRSVSSRSESDSDSDHRIPQGYIAVDVGPARELFVIPIRLLNLPVFAALLQRSAEQFGYPVDGPLILPCDARFLDRVLQLLKKDEERFGKLGLDQFLTMFSKVGIDSMKEKKKGSRKPTLFS